MRQTIARSISGLIATPILIAALLTSSSGAATAAAPPESDRIAPGPGAARIESLPEQRARWWFEQRAYPLKDIPQSALTNAFAQTQAARAIRAPAAVRADTWIPVGPSPYTGKDWVRPLAGRINAIATDPNDSSHWLIGASDGGIWESKDSGVTWAPRTDDQASLPTGAIAFAPATQNLVFAGTGDALPNGGGYGGAGLLKSTNGGATWTSVATAPFTARAFKRLIVQPNDSNILLAATLDGRAGRGKESPPATPTTGILKSTDGGANWTVTLTGTGTALAADPTNFSNQYAGLGDSSASADNGLYRSTNAGDSWTLVPGVPWTQSDVGRIEVAIAPSAGGTLYASIAKATATAGTLLGLWRTDNAWDATPTWTSIPVTATDNGTGSIGYCGWDVTQGGSQNNQCWYNHVISVDPSNANTLYAGGTPLWKCENCSTSPTWTEVSKNSSKPNGIHVDTQSMGWVSSTLLLVGNDGGLFGTSDGGTTWTSHNDHATMLFYEGSIHPTDPDFMLGGFQDNSSGKRTSGGANTWQELGGGDGADNAISSSRPYTDWAISDQNLSIRRTVDGGANFANATGNMDTNGAPFIARFEKCPANDDLFIAGAVRLWRTADFFSSAPSAPTWAANGVTTTGITAIGFAPSDNTCNTYAYGTKTGDLRLTTDGGANWVDIDPSGANAVANRNVTSVAFDPANANNLYVALSGFDESTPSQPGHVFSTTNALSATPTWARADPTVNIPMNALAVDPLVSGLVYVGTDMGVWRSVNGGVTWTNFGPANGMPNVAVFELKINRTTNRVVAFTHGRSAFMLDTGKKQVFLPTVVRPPAD